MTTLSNDAFAVTATCEETHKCFGITVDKVHSNLYKFVWSFKIDKEKAKREGYDQVKVRGGIILDSDFPGCPYCGEKRFVVCSSCQKFFCHHGQRHVTCPNCGSSGEISIVEQVDLKGGGF